MVTIQNYPSITVDVKDAATGQVIGEGPLFPISARATTNLDGAGTIELRFLLSDERARTLLQNERLVTIYSGNQQTFAEGFIQELRVEVGESDMTLVASGPDILNELQQKSTLLGRSYDNASLNSVISDLAALAGWTASTNVAESVYARFDGQSALKSLRKVAEQYGLHLRQTAPGTKSIEMKALGISSGLRITNIAHHDALYNEKLLIIDKLTQVTSSRDVVNWIVPVGSGNGEAVQTLEQSTRSSPYPIQTMTGPDGRTLHYLQDLLSIANYGQNEKVAAFKQVGPLSNNDTDLERGANALYDLSSNWLLRNRDPLTTVSVTVRPSLTVDISQIRVGDKVRLSYKGVTYRENGEPYSYLDVDTEFWIMSVRRSIGAEGLSYTLDLSNVDRRAMDTEEIVLGALEAIELGNTSVEPYFTSYVYPYEGEIDSSHSITIPYFVTNATRQIRRVLLRLASRPFRTLASGASSGGGTSTTSASGGGGSVTSASGGSASPTSAGGGDHNHRMFIYTTLTPPPLTTKLYNARTSNGSSYPIEMTTPSTLDLYTYDSSGAHTHTVTIPAHQHTVTIPAHEHTVTISAHTHTLTYAINDDSTYPGNVTVTIDGLDRTAALGGPWGTTVATFSVELDITQYIADPLRQTHSIVVGCGIGQGIVQGNLHIFEEITSIIAT